MLSVQEIEITKLKPWEDNPRINDHAVESVAKSIKSFGFNVPILYDQNFTIIAGHTRWKAAQKLGMTSVPAIKLEMDPNRRKAFSIADNKTAEIADWDLPKLDEIIKELKLEDFSVEDLGFSEVDIEQMMKELRKDLGIDDDKLPEVTDEDPITKTGDLVLLGEHRLLCGDSRDGEEIKLLTEGEKIDHVFGGPPYFNQREYAQWGDYQSYLDDMGRIIGNCRDLLNDGGVIVWNIANDCTERIDLTSHHSRLLEDAGLSYLEFIVWYKTSANYAIPRNFHITRNRFYYPAFQWEALLVYQKPGKMPRMSLEGMKYMKSCHTNVWVITTITNQVQTYGHPAVCPVEIPLRSILGYTGDDATVFEPFGGSGTTLIAAEKTGRKAFLMERNPIYYDMIVRRWEKFTEKRAERIRN